MNKSDFSGNKIHIKRVEINEDVFCPTFVRHRFKLVIVEKFAGYVQNSSVCAIILDQLNYVIGIISPCFIVLMVAEMGVSKIFHVRLVVSQFSSIF